MSAIVSSMSTNSSSFIALIVTVDANASIIDELLVRLDEILDRLDADSVDDDETLEISLTLLRDDELRLDDVSELDNVELDNVLGLDCELRSSWPHRHKVKIGKSASAAENLQPSVP